MPLPKRIMDKLRPHAPLTRKQRNALLGEPVLGDVDPDLVPKVIAANRDTGTLLTVDPQPLNSRNMAASIPTGTFISNEPQPSANRGETALLSTHPQPPFPEKSPTATGDIRPVSSMASNMLRLFEGLCASRWGIPKEKRHLLVNRMSDIALGEDTLKDTAIRAFLALVEAEKVDLAAVKVLIDGYSASSDARKDQVVKIDSLNLPVDARREVLKAMREQKSDENELKSA